MFGKIKRGVGKIISVRGTYYLLELEGIKPSVAQLKFSLVPTLLPRRRKEDSSLEKVRMRLRERAILCGIFLHRIPAIPHMRIASEVSQPHPIDKRRG